MHDIAISPCSIFRRLSDSLLNRFVILPFPVAGRAALPFACRAEPAALRKALDQLLVSSEYEKLRSFYREFRLRRREIEFGAAIPVSAVVMEAGLFAQHLHYHAVQGVLHAFRTVHPMIPDILLSREPFGRYRSRDAETPKALLFLNGVGSFMSGRNRFLSP